MSAGSGGRTTRSLFEAGGTLIRAGGADVGRQREARRRRRLGWLGGIVAVVTSWAVYHAVFGGAVIRVPIPSVDPMLLTMIVFFGVLAAVALLPLLVAGRSPHVTFQPDQIPVRLDDVKGIDPVKEEVVRSLNLFLAHATFAAEMGGTPRRGLLFEGSPGTGKTHLAKAMAAEAGVPFLFVSATAFQSMFYGATARKIRSFFRVLRKVARREGGAIAFIEEIDAIAGARGGLSMRPAPALTGSEARPVVSRNGVVEGVGGVVNELLVQMQSFDTPTVPQRAVGLAVKAVNAFLPAGRQLPMPRPAPANVLLIAATNRADSLDPALLRPGRFDRRLTFDLPSKIGRRELVDLFLSRKAHAPELDRDERRDALAAVTTGYSPVMIEHLLDEALVNALRGGRRTMNWADIEKARLTEEVGLGQPTPYTDHERRLIATHEAGHTTVAWLVAPERRLEVLSIVKRRDSLGLLAHGDRDDVYTRSRSEMLALIQIAFGGQCAEELFFGEVSTGPAGDLAYATRLAAEMVGSAGMAGSLISFAAVEHGVASDVNMTGRVLADAGARSRLEGLLEEQKGVARGMLSRHRHLVEALRDALLERDELVGPEITDVLEAAASRQARTSGGQLVIDLRDDATAARGGAATGPATGPVRR